MNNNMQSFDFNSVSQLHEALGIAKPRHPLFSIIRFEDFPQIKVENKTRLIADFYQITLKKECPCKIQYGQTMFDFDEGIISCFAPKQINIIRKDFTPATSGWQLCIHADFLRAYPLGQKIKDYGFFDYEINEALILSDEEQKSIEKIFEQIETEYHLPIDNFSQDVIVSYIDLLLSYCNRYYSRQFITRKTFNSSLLARFDELLNVYFADALNNGLPTVGYFAENLNVSSKYLNDCLKQVTGQTTQELIHRKLMEEAKDLLASSELSVSEIAFRLGFEYSQSFSKLFKNKTNQTPVEYRLSFNNQS